MGLLKVLLASHAVARSSISKRRAFCGVRASVVFGCPFFTHERAVRESVYMGSRMSALRLQQCQTVNQREILAYIIGAPLERSYMKDTLAGAHPHALILHRAGVFEHAASTASESRRISGKSS